MVTSNAIGKQPAKRTISVARHHGAPGGMIHFLATKEPLLKCIGVLAQVMQVACHRGHLAPAKVSGIVPGQIRHIGRVLQHGLMPHPVGIL